MFDVKNVKLNKYLDLLLDRYTSDTDIKLLLKGKEWLISEAKQIRKPGGPGEYTIPNIKYPGIESLKWYQSDFAMFIAIGIAVFLLCLGVGTCCHLAKGFPPPQSLNQK